MPSRRPPKREPEVHIFPNQLRVGDRFMDEESEWEIVSRPVTFKQGHEVRARVQRPGDPGTAREKYWVAHETITVKRSSVIRPVK